jgi:hypothetical protein
MSELIQQLSVLGDNALLAFIIYQIKDFIQFCIAFGLMAWGCITVWRYFVRENDITNKRRYGE